MTTRMSTPQDLAAAVSARLIKKRGSSPTVDVLAEIFEVMFVTSLKTEEGRGVRFAIVYLDPANADPSPPTFPPEDRWSCTQLENRQPWNANSLVKLAMASDPRSSSLAIFRTTSGLAIWGLVDQQHAYHDFVNQDSEVGPERPGTFQAQVEGPGHIRVFMDYEKIAELRIDRLVGASIDVLHGGVIRSLLEAGIRVHYDEVRNRLDRDLFDVDRYWESSLADKWIAALSRILLRVQNYRHGGALLIAPPNSSLPGSLDVKYRLQYVRLRRALADRASYLIQNTTAWEVIASDYMDKDVEEMPLWLHVESDVTQDQVEGTLRELDGATRFVSLLTRVDGLVLMSPELDVVGFGVEITEQALPTAVLQASSRTAGQSRLKKLDYYQYGTRHRSMLRYCWSHPGSVGFVVSQDGDLRAMTKVGEAVVLWDDIKLRVEFDFVREARIRQRPEVGAPRSQ